VEQDSYSDTNAIMRFADNFDVVLSALQDISKDADIDAKTGTKALSLINAISSSSFVVSLAAAKKVMSLFIVLTFVTSLKKFLLFFVVYKTIWTRQLFTSSLTTCYRKFVINWTYTFLLRFYDT